MIFCLTEDGSYRKIHLLHLPTINALFGICVTIHFYVPVVNEFLELMLILSMMILICREDNQPKWYKFDDGDVTECKMEDDEVCLLFTSS